MRHRREPEPGAVPEVAGYLVAIAVTVLVVMLGWMLGALLL